MPRPHYNMELIATERLAPGTWGLTFKVENPPEFEAGQFISVHFQHQGQELKRSYSIASSPELLREQGIIEIAIALVKGGQGSQFFAQLTVGERVTMSGPFGMLTLPEKLPDRLILAGTGTGMAPYRAMLAQLNRLAAQGQVIHILMGARTRADLIYQLDFQSLAVQESVTYVSCLSRELAIKDDGREYSGYVQQRLERLSLEPGRDLIFLCGNPFMVDDCVQQLTEAGFGPRDIKREKYTFSR